MLIAMEGGVRFELPLILQGFKEGGERGRRFGGVAVKSIRIIWNFMALLGMIELSLVESGYVSSDVLHYVPESP